MTTEPLLLVADLLHALGWALWTGVVVVFVHVVPEAKRRQLKGALEAYRQRSAPRPQPQATRRRGTTKRRRRGSGQVNSLHGSW